MHLARTAVPLAVLVSLLSPISFSFARTASTDPPKQSYIVGQPYRIKGQRYYPREDLSYNRVGIASWYGEAFHGRRTANGETYNMDALTAAHPTLPLATVVRVSNLDNGRSINVRINDRGPYAQNRIIDMSRAGARALGFDRKGMARVRVTVLRHATLWLKRRAGAAEADDDEGSAATTSARRRARSAEKRRSRGRTRGR